MSRAAFPYPGGKSDLAEWIISHFAEHTGYVEPFGGSGAVLLNKPRSEVEVYNDLDGDLVHFFTVLRDRCDELRAWLRRTPYSREIYDEYADAFYGGERPADDVVRAGRFFYLRYTAWGAKYDEKPGFRRNYIDPPRDQSSAYANKVRALDAFADRFEGVAIEQADYREVLERYDGPETLFYLDPPYFDADGYYQHPELDHAELVDALEGVESDVVVSASKVPDGLSSWPSRRVESTFAVGSGKAGSANGAPERLLFNYEPDTAPRWSGVGQAALTAYVEGGDRA